MVRTFSPRALLALLTLSGALLLPPVADAAGLGDPVDQWLPSVEGATWTYQWSDSAYAPARHTERYTVRAASGTQFRLAWEGDSAPAGEPKPQGTMDFRRAETGLLNTSWASTPPSAQFPILCASAADCGNSLAGALYMTIWGSRSPVIAEPLYAGTRWNTTGGAANDVTSANRYLGTGKVVVPAFPKGVEAAKIESVITQAGSLGDTYGSGVRTTYWVRGVGPVRVAFRHAGGEYSYVELIETSLTPRPAPSDAAPQPLNRGDRFKLRWRNSKHMKRWSTQRFDVAEVQNGTARVDVRSLKGAIRVAGSYIFATRLGGLFNTSAALKAASRARFPRLGPTGAPVRFLTPLDLLAYGQNPIVPAHPAVGQRWKTDPNGRDWKIFRVAGRTKVERSRTVRVPAGRFKAIVVRSRLKQKGFAFGSGTRTSYFAPNVGLVKLVFRHADGSVSTVERIK